MTANLIDPKAIERYLDRFLPGQPEAARLLKLALARPLAQRDQNLANQMIKEQRNESEIEE